MSGYRYSVDPFLLASFANCRGADVVVDLGSGDAILPLLLCRMHGLRSVHAVEIQPSMLEKAQRLLQQHDLAERVALHRGDVRTIEALLSPQSCDIVVTNPPYRKPGKGKVAPHPERAAARHELHGGLEDFLGAAAYLLGDGGRFYIVYLAERLVELLEGMRRLRLEPKRLRCVHGRIGDVAKMVLVEGRKGGGAGLKLEAPLIVYAGEEYSPEVQAIYDQFRELRA